MKSLGGRSLSTSSKKSPNVNNMNLLLQEAQKAQLEMQNEIEEMENSLADVEVEATAGGGVVKVIATCDLRIKDIILSEEVEDEDFDTLKDLIIAATNEVIQKAIQLKEEKTNEISEKYLGQLPDFGF